MTNEESRRRKEERIQRQFDLFVKRSLENITGSVLRNYCNDLKKQYAISIEEMEDIPAPEEELRSEKIQVRVGDTTFYLEDEELANAIRRLPKRLLKIIEMRFFKEMEYDDICKALNLKSKSVENYTSDGLIYLRKFLSGDCDEKKL